MSDLLHYDNWTDLERKVIDGERPPISPILPPKLIQLMEACWHADPLQRPTFEDINVRLRHLQSSKGVVDVLYGEKTATKRAARSRSM